MAATQESQRIDEYRGPIRSDSLARLLEHTGGSGGGRRRPDPHIAVDVHIEGRSVDGADFQLGFNVHSDEQGHILGRNLRLQRRASDGVKSVTSHQEAAGDGGVLALPVVESGNFLVVEHLPWYEESTPIDSYFIPILPFPLYVCTV